MLPGFVLPGPASCQDQDWRARGFRRVPRHCLRALRGAGWPRLTRGRTQNLTLFAQAKAKREDHTEELRGLLGLADPVHLDDDHAFTADVGQVDEH